MALLSELKSLDRPQKSAILASFLGWALDAFDFFLMVFMLSAVAQEFRTDVPAVALAVTLTLAARPFGAFFFGWLADRFGRRPILMVDILLYSVFELASAFAPSLTVLIVLRTLFGFAMGGEWGIGASLVMESVPPRARGVVSGVLQAGYPTGFLLASLVFYLLFDTIGWRGMFMVGFLPALLVLFIRMGVHESPVFEERQAAGQRENPIAVIVRHWKMALYLVVLMTAFNFFSHGTQDLYPTFLQKQHGFDTHMTGLITGIMNVGAITGGIFFGAWSERIGRRKAIMIASLLALPILPLWAFTATPLLLGIGAFLMQVAVQGAWGVVPVHLNEMSPAAVRGMFPGFAYQAGNLIASGNATIQAGIAARHGGNYSLALAIVAGVVAILISGWAMAGPERRGTDFAEEERVLAREGGF